MCRLRAIRLAVVATSMIVGPGGIAQAASIWVQSDDDDALEWSGAKSEVTGLVHSNGGIRLSGAQNAFIGGMQLVGDLDNANRKGPRANVIDPAPVAVVEQPWPRRYSLDGFRPGGAIAIAAGADYVDLSSDCLASGGDAVQIKAQKRALSGRVFWVPCDVLFDAKGYEGEVTVAATGKIHFKAHNDSQLTGAVDGILAVTTAAGNKAIHLNGNRSTLLGDFLAEFGEIHVAGSNQAFSCGLYADRIKVSGASFEIGGGRCADPVVNQPPVAVDDSANTPEGIAVTIDLLANDSDPDGVIDPTSVEVVSPPANGAVIIDLATGVGTYTPNEAFVGTDQFEYRVADDSGAFSGSALVTVIIQDVNAPPVVVDDAVTTAEDTPVLIDPLANDFDNDGILDPSSLAIIDAPVNGTAVVDAVEGLVNYAPDPDFFGSDRFVYTIADDNGTVSEGATVAIDVTPVNDLPIVVSQTVTLPEDGSVSVIIEATDADGDPLTFLVVDPPANGSVSGSGPEFVYTPAPDFFGSDAFAVAANDGTATSAPGTVSIEITSVNDAPVALPQAVTTTEDTTVAIVLSGTDVDGDNLSFLVDSGPSGGALTGSPPNLIYTPSPNFAGSDSFTFKANDGALDSPAATVSIEVIAANDLPSLEEQIFTGTEDVVLNLTVQAFDRDGDALVFTIEAPPSSGQLIGTGPSFTYTPDLDFNGSDSFSVSVSDGIGTTPAITMGIEIQPINDVPLAIGQLVMTPEDTPVAVSLSGTDVDGDALTYAVVDSPVNGALSGTAPSLTYTPTPDFTGMDRLSFIVSDGTVDSEPATVSITVEAVNDDPVANAQSVTTAEDTPVAVVLTGSDPDGDTLTFSVVSGPARGTLSGTAPLLTYTPNPDFAGGDSFTFIASDGSADSAPATVSIAVDPVNDAPLADSQSVVTSEDTAVAIVLTGSDVDGDMLTFSVVGDPASGTLSGTAPLLTYTPNPDFAGSDSFTFIASDGSLDSVPATVSISVDPSNDVPLAAAQTVSTPEDTPLPIVLGGSDVDGDALTFLVASGPTNGTLGGSPPNLTYTPAADFNGDDAFTFVANDGTADSSPATVSISVEPVNDPPVADAQSVSTSEDNPLDIVLSGSDVDGDALNFIVTGEPANGALSGTPPSLTYTPNADFSGSDTLTYIASDGTVDSAPATVSISVGSVNDPPVIVDQTFNGTEDIALPLTIAASDPDGDTLTFSVATAPTSGALSGAGPDFTFTPDPDFNGSDSFAVAASDGSDTSAPATISIEIAAVNDAPSANSISVTTAEDTPVEIVLAGDDVDGDAISFVIRREPTTGTLSSSAPNLTYTPDADFAGADSFVFITSDGTLESAEATVSITVEAANDAPTADAQSVSTPEDTPLGITLTGSDPDGDALTFNVTGGPANGTLSGAAPNLSYLPDPNFNGDDAFTFEVSDGVATSAAAVISISVSAVNDLPVADDLTLDVVAGVPMNVTLTGSDDDGDDLTFSVITQPSNGTLSGTAPALAYTADAGFSGTDQFTFIANDGIDDSAPGTVTLNVTDDNADPVITSTPVTMATLNSTYTYQVVATDADGDTLGFFLSSAPPGMSITASGLVEWPVTTTGSFEVTIEVTDGNGGVAEQTYSILVSDNNAPEFVQLPSLFAPRGEFYRSTGQAVDPDADPVGIELASGPAGALLTDAGDGRFELTWTSAEPVGESVPFEIVAIDTNGARATLNLDIVTTGATVNRSHLGTDFWLAFATNFRNESFGLGAMPLNDPGRQLQLEIGAPEGATGLVEIEGLSLVVNLDIAPGGAQRVDLPIEAMGLGGAAAVDAGVHVTTDRPVTVVSINWADATTDAWLALPTNTLGSQYMITGYKDKLFQPNSDEIIWAVLAVEDNTTFTLTPLREIPERVDPSIGDPITQTLNRGEFRVDTTRYAFSADIVADKPVAVFGGSSCADVPTGIGTCDHLWQQFVPENTLATEYFAAPLAERVGSLYRVIATEDGTLVYLNGVYRAKLDRGQTLETTLPAAVSIRASKPVVAVQYATGFEFDGEPATQGTEPDPSMLNLAPVDAFLSSYTVVVPSGDGVFRNQPNDIVRPPIDRHYLAIVIPQTAADSLVLDGTPVDTTDFEPIPDSDYLAGNILIDPGTHQLYAAAQFGVTAYGWGVYESYAFYAGLVFPDGTTSIDVTASGPSAPLVAGSEEACIDIVTSDLRGARAPRARYALTIEGNFPLSEVGFTDQVGEAHYCYTQPGPGRDTISIVVNGDNETLTVDWLADTDPTINGAPRIISLPELVLYEATFNYPMEAADPDGDTIRWEIVEGPAGAAFSFDTLVWTPPIPADRAPTTHIFEVLADDGNGGTDTQRFEIKVYYPAIFEEPYPATRRFQLFSGSYETPFGHRGGDPNRLVGEMVEGEGSVSFGGFGSDPRYYIRGRSQLIEQYEFTDLHNPTCRAPSSTLGQFSLAQIWSEPVDDIVDSAVAGPVVDTNGDGVVNDADDIYAAFAERGGVSLFNVTTRETTMRVPIRTNGHAFGADAAMANIDADIDIELLYVHYTTSDIVRRLTAYNPDGSVAWRSSHAPLTGDYTRGERMPILPVDLDNDGVTEILYGPYVYDNNGNVLWQFDTTAIGEGSSQGVPLAVDLDGDGLREVLFQDEVRDANGDLLWSLPYGKDVRRPQVYFATGELSDNPGLEIVASIATPDGVFHEAFTADGSRLWGAPLEGIGHSLPVIMDFDRDGRIDIFLPNGRTFVDADGGIVYRDSAVGNAIVPTFMDLDRDGIVELFEYGGSNLSVRDPYSRRTWYTRGFTDQTFGFAGRFLWQSTLWIDPDHDGEAELFVVGERGKGLYESRAVPVPLPPRRYSQVFDFHQPVIGFDTDFGTPDAPGLADAWIGRVQFQQITEQEFAFQVEVRNKGVKAINDPFTVEFYRGRIADNDLFGSATVEKLDVNESRIVSIPATFDDRAPVMSARLVMDPATQQCDVRNDEIEGELHTIELRDGPTPYRTTRWTYLHQQYWVPRDVGISVRPSNTTIQLGTTYRFDADGTLGDEQSTIGNGIWFGLSAESLAKGMQVDSTSGEITWTPTFDHIGSNTFRLLAYSVDDDGSHSFTITVEPRPNELPVITSSPPSGLILTGQAFGYDVEATDADGDFISFGLSESPTGMVIDTVSGLIGWTPDATQIGLFPVTVTADDGFGGVATQSLSIQVGSESNTPPSITSTPPFSAKAGFDYRYQVEAEDANGDFLTYTVETGPAGMTIDSAGLLSWTPTAAGVENIVMRVSDGQAFVEQGWTLSISDADIPLDATLTATPLVADLGQSVELAVGYSGAAGAVDLSLSVNGVAVPVDPTTGIGVYTPTDVGQFVASAIVSDPYATATASTTFNVIDPSLDSQPPVVSLSAPDFEQEVTAPIDAIGTVDDPDDDLTEWFLALQPRGAGPTEFTTLASGTTEVPGDVLAQIDPSMLLNGLYAVILQASDAAGNVAQDTRVIRVTGDLKVGNFSITFEDFSAPVAGIPVTVLRTYDTRRRSENLDFGYGWTVDYQNVRIQESRDIGFSWSLIEQDFGFFSTFCVKPNGDPTVTVRLPDGELESFVARAEPECTELVPTVDVQIVFEPIDGTDTTLEQTDFGVVRIVNGNIVDLGEPDTPIDPDAYRLTTAEGFVYELDQAFGVRRVIDTHGNTLTYSDSGVIHSQGFSLTFNRDAEGRITSILAPDGSSMAYGYDGNGDLASFTDPVGNVTTFTYTNATDHYLEDIIDPRGVRVSRNEYDADGRLIAIIDADGNRIEYTHDITGRTETIRDRRGNATTYIYDDEGNVLLETNALGETTTRTYDEDRNVLTETNDLGETMFWTYDERGNVLTETNALGETTTSTYDDRNLLLAVIDPLGLPVMTNVYDSRNTNLLTMTDALGQTTSFFWDTGIGAGCSTGASRGTEDALGNRTTIQPQCAGPFGELPAWEEDPRGVRTTFAYDSLGRMISETTTRTDEFGVEQTLVTTMAYDEKGRVVSVTDPEGNVAITEYNAIDKEAATIDPNGNRTEYGYDSRGNRVLTRYPDGTTETVEYDAEGNMVAQTDRLGRTTRMVYDAANRLLETVFPDDTPGSDIDNPRTRSEYDRAGRLVATIDERGNRTEYVYDAAGRQVLVRDALGQETRFEYDARGLRTAMIDALSRRTEYVYDTIGRLVETIYPDDTPGDASDNLRMLTGYDALGRKTSETDLAALTTNFEYGPVGNLVAVVDALGQRTEYGYDEQSNKVSQTDAEGRATRWSYDDAGRVISRTLPLGQRETYGYDAAGNRIAHTDFNGSSHSFAYDSLNREISASYADGITVTTTYTETGQVETVTDDRGTTSYSYDERERLTQITYPTGKSIDYGYDATGNRISLDTANQSLAYTFDPLNRLATVTDEAGTTTYGYDAVGNRASMDYANGTRTTYAYDPLNRLLELSHFDPVGTAIDRHTYTLGPNGNRLQHAELNGRVVDYTYDGLYRLTSETVTDSTLGNRSASWSYDAVGNRLIQVETNAAGTTTTNYSYDGNDRLLTETAAGLDPYSKAFTYDDNGNTLTESDGVATTTYAYDSRNRLMDLNAGQVTYLYDANGIRMSETAAGLTTNYLVDPNRDYAQVIEESFDLNSFAEVKYIYGDDLIAQHRRIDPSISQTSTYHYDGLGSTRLLTDSSGTVTDSYTFSAFGELETSSGFTLNKHRYTGEYFDPSLGFYYLRARYYNQGIGRFATMDTYAGQTGEPMTLHKYQYVHSNPVNATDPTGLFQLAQQVAAQRVSGVINTLAIATLTPHYLRAKSATDYAVDAQIIRNCALTQNSRCRTKRTPILFYGADVLEVAEHIVYAQSEHSLPALLHRKKTIPRRRQTWVTRQRECRGKTYLGSEKQCDEYPMNASHEGGLENYRLGKVSLRPLDKFQNQSAGSKLNQMFAPYGCNVPGTPIRRSKRSQFGVVPVPSLDKTFYYCGRKR